MALKDCIKKLNKVVSKADRELLQGWIEQGLSDDEVLQRYDLHIDKTLFDISKRAQDKGAKVSLERDVLGEVRSFAAARLAKAQTRLAEVRAEHGALNQDYGEISWLEGTIKHWEAGGPNIDIHDDGALLVRFQQMMFVHKKMFKGEGLGEGVARLKGRDAYQLRDSFRAMQAKGDEIRAKMYELFLEEVELVNLVDDIEATGDGNNLDSNGEYFQGPKNPPNVKELGETYTGSVPWKMSTGKDAEGDLYIQRVGPNAGTPHKTRHGPSDIAISFDQEVLLPSYAFYLLQYLQPQIQARSHGTAQQAVNKRDIEQVMIRHFQGQVKEDTGDAYTTGQSTQAQTIEDSTANYKAIVRQHEEREISVGITQVNSAADAAHILAEIRKNASEGFWAVVLDADNNVVGIVEHGRGTIDGTSVYPSTYAGAVHSIPGAAKVWMAHNHPSGVLEVSQADQRITKRISALLVGSGVEVQGHVLLGGGSDKFTTMKRNGDVESMGDQITPAVRNKKVKVFTRKIAGKQTGTVIRSPADTENLLRQMGNPEGIVLLNNRHKYLGFLSMTPEEMRVLKGTGQSGRVIRAMAEMNAAAFIVSTKESQTAAANNMYNFAQMGDWRMLDAVYRDTNGQHASMAGRGELVGNANTTNFYQSQIGFSSGLLTAVQTMSREKGTVAEMLGGLRKTKKNKKGDMVTTYAPGVTKAEMDWLDVEAWAEAKGGVITRQEMIDYVRANGIIIEEVQARGQQAYSGQSLPGGTEPRDIFLKMPEIPEDTLIHKFQIVTDGIGDVYVTDDQADDLFTFINTDPQMAGAVLTREGQGDRVTLMAENITEQQLDLLIRQFNETGLTSIDEETTDFRVAPQGDLFGTPQAGLAENFPMSHFQYKNVLAWIRTTERTGPNGERILFIEEIQSDWHQRGAKRGYRDPIRPVLALDEFTVHQNEFGWFARELDGKLLQYGDQDMIDAGGETVRIPLEDAATPELAAVGLRTMMKIKHKEMIAAQPGKVPQAPFKGRGWPKLAMKRMIRLAAEEGYDSVSFITGDQANVRNSVATYVETMTYDPFTGTLFAMGVPGVGDRTITMAEADFDTAMGPEVAQSLRDEIEAVKNFYDIIVNEETGRYEIVDGNAEYMRDSTGEIIEELTLQDAEEKMWQELNYQDLLPTISGDQLGAVGEGVQKFQNFYDEEVVNLTNQAARKLDKNAGVQKFGQDIYTTDGAPFTHELRRATGLRSQSGVGWYVVDYQGRQTNGPFEEESMAKGTAEQRNATVETVHTLPITDQMRAAALEGQTLFQNKKGAISFDQARRGIIKLTESRDLSTFMHEAGHLYLEIMRTLAEDPGTPQAVKDDYAKILEFLGVSSADEITREHHELWAESFEKYLQEGNAPSVALQSAFNAFRRWLTEIWKRIKGDSPDGIILTPEIRGVMDRILASDDQIAVANQRQEFSAIFQTAEQMGVSQRVFDVYKANILKANNDAIEKETIRLMEAAGRESRVWWRDEKAKVKAQVEAEHHEKLVYQAFFALARGTKPDGSPTESAPFKIDKESLLELLAGSTDALKRLPKPWVYSVKNGVDVDVAARALGYPAGTDLVKALMEMPNMKDSIEVETMSRMNALYPDPLMDGSVSENAIKAVHNERRVAILAAEMRELRRLMNEDRAIVSATKQDIKTQATASREANKGTLPKREELALIKAAARKMVGAMRVMDVQPHVYLAAERKAGRLAFEAAARGDYEKAYNFKRQQVANHEMYRAALKAKENAVKTRNYLTKFLKPRVQQRLGKLGVIEPILAILEGVELAKKSLKQVNLDRALKGLVDAVESGQIVVSPGTLEKIMDPAINWQELTIEELEGLKDIIKQLEFQAKKKLEMPVNGEMIDMEAATQELTEQILETNEVVDIGIGEKTKKQRRSKQVKSGLGHWLSPSVMANLLDNQGWGAVTRLMIIPIRRAIVDRLIPMQQKAITDMHEIYRKFYNNKELRQIAKKGFAEINGETLSHSDVLSIALNMGNEGNKQALFNGMRIDGKIAYPEDEVRAALDKLTARDWHFVQATWDYLDTYWPALAETQRERRGIAPEKVESTPFTVETSDGQSVIMQGGYYPLKYNFEHSERHEEAVFEDHFSSMGNGVYVSANTRAGATHNRVKNHAMVVNLGLHIIDRHLKEITRDIAIGNEVNFVKNLINDKNFRNAMKVTGNDNMLKELNLWLTDAAVGELPANSEMERWMAWARVGFTKSKLAFNVYTAALQLTGYAQSLAVIGGEAMVMGVGMIAKNPIKAWKHAFAISRFLQVRYDKKHLAFDKDVHDAAGMLKEYGQGLPTIQREAWEAFGRSMFWPIAKMQQFVDVTTWYAGFWKGRNRKGLNDDEAILYADSQVELAQTSGFFSDRSGVERGTLSATTRQNQFIRLWTTLLSYMARKGNIAYMKHQGFKRDMTMTNAIRYATDMLLLFTIEGMASAALYGRWPEDDPDPEEILMMAFRETALSVMAGIPFVREIPGAQYGSGNTPIGGLTNDLFKLYVQSMQGEIDPAFRKAFVNSFGTMFHLPASQTNRLLEALIDEDDPEILEYLTGTRD